MILDNWIKPLIGYTDIHLYCSFVTWLLIIIVYLLRQIMKVNNLFFDFLVFLPRRFSLIFFTLQKKSFDTF